MKLCWFEKLSGYYHNHFVKIVNICESTLYINKLQFELILLFFFVSTKMVVIFNCNPFQKSLTVISNFKYKWTLNLLCMQLYYVKIEISFMIHEFFYVFLIVLVKVQSNWFSEFSEIQLFQKFSILLILQLEALSVLLK